MLFADILHKNQMRWMKMNKPIFSCQKKKFFCGIALLFCLSGIVFAQKADMDFPGNNVLSDDTLIQQYYKAKGLNYIVFDSSNIKQYWTDKSIVSQKDSFTILTSQTTSFKSVPLKIQLTNVNAAQDCLIEVITDTPDLEFTISNQNRTLSQSSSEQFFIQHRIVSTSFHLEDSDNFSFNIVFSSAKSSSVSIKAIILSFSKNPTSLFLEYPEYDTLMNDFKNRGVSVQENEVQYLISKKQNMIFFRIPKNQTEHPFFYHIYPTNKEDLAPNRVQYGFNNLDFSIKNKNAVYPKPFSAKDEHVIVCRRLPSYQYNMINIGQHSSGKRIWTVTLQDKP